MISQISDQEIEYAKDVQRNFIVQDLNHSSALESGIFAILNQASPWERPSKIIYKLREASYPGDKNARSKYATPEILHDIKKVNAIAKENGWRFPHQPRLESLIGTYSSRSDNWWEEIKNGTPKQRNETIKNVSYISMKTFSFWHLCLGGTDYLPLDIHVRRQLAKLGVPMKKEFYEHVRRPHHKEIAKQKEIDCNYLIEVPIERKKDSENSKLVEVQGTKVDLHSQNSQLVVDEPNFKEYKKIERAARKLFRTDPRFLYEEKVNMGLVASVLWWRGANRGEPHQGNLLNGSFGGSWKLPYGI